MRFCTTHRACETVEGLCGVAVAVANHVQKPCILVDALIVEKVDGKWPEWFSEIIGQWIVHPDMFFIDLEDALYEAAKETL